MIFIINSPETKSVGTINWLEFTAGSPRRTVGVQGAALMHLEFRHSAESGGDFVALVYKLPEKS